MIAPPSSMLKFLPLLAPVDEKLVAAEMCSSEMLMTGLSLFPGLIGHDTRAVARDTTHQLFADDAEDACDNLGAPPANPLFTVTVLSQFLAPEFCE